MFKPLSLLAGALLLGGSFAIDAHAQTPLTTVRIASGLQSPIWAGAPKGDDRLFIVQKGGRVRILQGGTLLATDFLDIGSLIQSGSEKGLLGMAFHPDYASNGYFYVNYTRAGGAGGTSVVVRYTVSANPDVADATSALELLTLVQPFTNHNGGGIAFGPDGMLYIGFGDGGSSNDPACNAQNLGTWHGKMLRIDVDGGTPYAVPADNPFVGTAGALPEIWQYGLRNPWRWSFDSETGDLYIGDVGQNNREEVDVTGAGVGGLNFGWKQVEGTRCNTTTNCPPTIPPCGDPSLVVPVVELTHGGFSGPCSVIGGYVYRGCAIPDLQGTYFYSDYCDDLIRSFEWTPTTGVTNQIDRTAELTPSVGSISSISSFGEDGFGELVIVDYGGEVYSIQAASPPAGLLDCDGNGRDDLCEIEVFPVLDLDGDNQLDACQGLSADAAGVSISAGVARTAELRRLHEPDDHQPEQPAALELVRHAGRRGRRGGGVHDPAGSAARRAGRDLRLARLRAGQRGRRDRLRQQRHPGRLRPVGAGRAPGR
jgi:glucose/arabinose dehydrogenase